MILASIVAGECFIYQKHEWGTNIWRFLDLLVPPQNLVPLLFLQNLRGTAYVQLINFQDPIHKSAGIFPSTFPQPVNGSKNSILNWVIKLNLLMCFFLGNTLERFSIAFCYSNSLVQTITNMHKGKLYVRNLKKCIFQQSTDLNFEDFPFGVYHGTTQWSHWTKQTVKKLNLWGKTAVHKSAWIKTWSDIDIDQIIFNVPQKLAENQYMLRIVEY